MSLYCKSRFMHPVQARRFRDQFMERTDWIDYYEDAGRIAGETKQQYIDLPEDEWPDLYEATWNRLVAINKQIFGFDITGWQQPLRVARYGVGFKQDWHVDYTDEDLSKLAFSMALTQPAKYEGGRLELLEVRESILLPMGDAAVFPAFHGHRVTMVTKGERYVFLGWATGPRFV